MSTITAYIRRMLAAGLDIESALVAAEQFESDPVKMRSAGAKRQERYRTRKASQTVTCDTGDGSDAKRNAPPSPKDTSPSSETTVPRSKPQPPIVPLPKTRRCPSDFWPNENVVELAASKGIGFDELSAEVDRMKDHQFRDAHNDWNAVMRNWLRTYAERRGKARSPPLSFDLQDALAREAGDRLFLAKHGAQNGNSGNGEIGDEGLAIPLPRHRQITAN